MSFNEQAINEQKVLLRAKLKALRGEPVTMIDIVQAVLDVREGFERQSEAAAIAFWGLDLDAVEQLARAGREDTLNALWKDGQRGRCAEVARRMDLSPPGARQLLLRARRSLAAAVVTRQRKQT